jgi:hypothetical protein
MAEQLGGRDLATGISERGTARSLFVVTNTGNVDLSNVGVTDSDFTPGERRQFAGCDHFDDCIVTAPGRQAAQQQGYRWCFTDDNDATDTDTDTENASGSNPEIDVEKSVSVDGGLTWVDADSPTGPYVKEGDPVQFKFVVTNTGDVALSSISLTDSDFSLAGCIIPATLTAGASFECTISTTAVLGQHTDTATASGSFTDGAGNTETDADTDDANYYGMPKGQPSIQIESLSIIIDQWQRPG